MTELIKRKIVNIDEEKCNGCGLCIPACAEGAIQLIDGKARLVSDIYCDGLGDCLGECPQDAINLEEREAVPFDEEAVEERLRSIGSDNHNCKNTDNNNTFEKGDKHEHVGQSPCCAAKEIKRPPNDKGTQISKDETGSSTGNPEETELLSELVNWPVQLHLVPPEAPFLRNPHLLIGADCVPFACADFHNKLLKDRTLLIGCPKLDDNSLYMEKLTAIFKKWPLQTVSVAIMEVPCCQGLYRLVEQAQIDAGADFNLQKIVIGVDGKIVYNLK